MVEECLHVGAVGFLVQIVGILAIADPQPLFLRRNPVECFDGAPRVLGRIRDRHVGWNSDFFEIRQLAFPVGIHQRVLLGHCRDVFRTPVAKHLGGEIGCLFRNSIADEFVPVDVRPRVPRRHRRQMRRLRGGNRPLCHAVPHCARQRDLPIRPLLLRYLFDGIKSPSLASCGPKYSKSPPDIYAPRSSTTTIAYPLGTHCAGSKDKCLPVRRYLAPLPPRASGPSGPAWNLAAARRQAAAPARCAGPRR